MKKQNELTEKELAKRLKLHPGTLANWRYRSKGPAWVKWEGRVSYPVECVEAYEGARKKAFEEAKKRKFNQ